MSTSSIFAIDKARSLCIEPIWSILYNAECLFYTRLTPNAFYHVCCVDRHGWHSFLLLLTLLDNLTTTRRLDEMHCIVNEWNRLSADCVGASSVNIFKNKIDIYLRRAVRGSAHLYNILIIKPMLCRHMCNFVNYLKTMFVTATMC